MLMRGLILTIGIIVIWQLVVTLFKLPPYILPGPLLVIQAWTANGALIIQQGSYTLLEALLGLILGSVLGVMSALSMLLFSPIRFWLLPLLVMSQAIPTFAVAPLFVIWFGYGLVSKIVVTILMLYFPVASAFFDGLRRTNSEWINMAKLMNGSRWRILWHIQVPAALPALASGLRMAAIFAPIGAIVGEWVGSSKGLGYLLLNANARMQIDLMFACLITLIIATLIFYYLIDKLLHQFIPWQRESS